MDSVAIIILTKNNFEVIKKCLDSFKEKNTYTNIKFYIGDTGSDKDCLSNLENYLHSFDYKKELLKFNYYNYSKNHNWIIKNRVKEEFILFCNDDIELINDALTLMMQESEPNIGSIGCKLLFPNKKIQHAGQIHAISKENSLLSVGHKLYAQADRELGTEYNVGNTGAFCITRTQVYIDIGGLNENYISSFEDVEYNINCSLKGLKHKFVGKAICFHHESLTKKSNLKTGSKQHPNDWALLKTKLLELYSDY
jgi:GT2 family glycosyltransferase